MSIEQNKAVVRRIHEEAESLGDLEVIDSLFAPDFRMPWHADRGTGPSPVKEHLRKLRAAFPDLRVTINDMVAEGDFVAVRLSMRGTQRGPFGSSEATGRVVQWSGLVLRRFNDVRVVEEWGRFDLGAQLEAAQNLPTMEP
jgi:predicted ester cyclase